MRVVRGLILKTAMLFTAVVGTTNYANAQGKVELKSGIVTQKGDASAGTKQNPQMETGTNETVNLSNDYVAAVNAEALTQYCKAANQYTEECLKSGKYFDMRKFNDRIVAKSKGQLVKLARGTKVHVLERSRPCAKIEADDVHHHRNIYMIMDLQLGTDDSPPDLPKLPFEKRTP